MVYAAFCAILGILNIAMVNYATTGFGSHVSIFAAGWCFGLAFAIFWGEMKSIHRI